MKRRKRGAKNDEDDDNGFAAWGGYMEAKKSKLLEQFNDAASNITNKQSNLFNGISIFVNGYTNPTAEELKQIMAQHGGIYHNYHSSTKTTYIIASNLPDAKIKQIGPNQKIIKPEWVIDCLQAGKLLDYSKYLLYTNCNRNQPKLNFKKVLKSESNSNIEVIDISDDELSPELFESYDDNKDVTNCEKENTILQNKTNTSTCILNTENADFKLSEIKKIMTTEKPGRTLSANDPKFLSEFYNNSRLHHISTLGATFKQHVCNLRDQSNFIFSERQKLKDYLKEIKRINAHNFSQPPKHPVIMHIDMDCFFVSVGLRKRPELKGIPVAVTHSKGGQEPSFRSGVDRQAELECYKKRVQEKLNIKNTELGPGNMFIRLEGIENQSMSEIASCSYEARKAGVKNGMFMGTALKLCPNLQTISYDFEGYKEVAYTLYNTISEYTLNIEAVSCDEMFVDITELLNDTGATVNEWATYIRSLIQKRTGCPCSTGFGQNRLQARVATKTAKPNGQFHLIPDAVEEYMVDIKVDDLPGVGRTTSLKLDSFSAKTCGDLQSISIARLRSEFGNKIGESLYNHCRGIDNRQLVYEHERKSVSAEINYGIRFTNNTEAETFLKQLVLEVHTRLTEIKMKGKCITLKLMVRSKDAPSESSKFMGHGICDHITKSNSLSVATNELNVVEREILSIAQKLSVPPEDLRGIGIQISKLEKNKNLTGGITKFLNSLNTTKTLTENNKKENNIINNNSVNSNIPKQLNSINFPIIDSALKNKKDLKSNKQNVIIDMKSPIKTEVIKTEKKISPVKNNTTKRGRGRPRGRGGKTIERKSSNNGDLTKFLATPTTNNNQGQIQLNGIDMEVFAALPENLKKEILTEYHSNSNYVENIESFVENNNNIYTEDNSVNNTAKQMKKLNTINKDKKEINKNIEGIPKNETKLLFNSGSSEVDMEVFAALPEDIRKEILAEYQSNYVENTELSMENNSIQKNKIGNNPTDQTKKLNTSNKEQGNQKNTEIHKRTEERIPHNEENISKDSSEVEVIPSTSKIDLYKNDNCMFSKMNVKEIKRLLEDWISSQNSPETCDVKMLGEYFKQLALDKKLGNLFELLKFLYSEVTSKNNCGWHKTYFEIANAAQDGMMVKYGSKIYTYKDFKCKNKCHLKSS